MKVCIVAHNAYGALVNDSNLHIGGVERQTAIMARWLVDAGHPTSVLTWTHGGAADEDVGGVRILKICRREEGLPGLRFLVPRWTSLRRAMARADADVYFHNCAEAITGQVALWARRHDRRFVFSVASDPECDPALPILPSFRERTLYTYGLRHADAILVQTRAQKHALATGFGLDSQVCKMPCPAPEGLDLDGLLAKRGARPRVLWVGRLAPVKNLQRLFAVAARLPEVLFDVVGGEDQDPDYAREMMRLGNDMANVTMHGRLSAEQVAPLLRKCWMLLCTSDYEGFPNTFLESWAHARPVLSTVDPDGLIRELGLGKVACDDHGLAEGIHAYCAAPDALDAASQRAHTYFQGNHAVDTAMQAFESAFQAVLR